MILVFVHGWSVTNTDTYGNLPEAVAAQAARFGIQLDIQHIWLGRYLSFYDEIRMSDVVRAFQQALTEQLGIPQRNKKFSCITHSTGGPVVRSWLDKYYGKDHLAESPLEHLIMLAPANHGSALAQLGKKRIGRLKSWFSGIEPGQRILDWLELGSDEQLALNRKWLDYPTFGEHNTFYPVVLTGQDIDSKLYDHLNSYTGEEGSDGVVRVAAANLNYRWVKLVETEERLPIADEVRLKLRPEAMKTSPLVPLGIIPDVSHSGDKMGIMKSVDAADTVESKPVLKWIIETLKVSDTSSYRQLILSLQDLTKKSHEAALTRKDEDERIPHCSMIVFRMTDDTGQPLEDYDTYFLGGAELSRDKLPKGFFIDRQRNSRSINTVTYFFNDDKLAEIEGGRLGLRVYARPQ